MQGDDKNTFCCAFYIRIVISGCCCCSFGVDNKEEIIINKFITNNYALIFNSIFLFV
jgi:hypothetical protein